MSDFSYIFTVFTPTYNRAHTLHIVFESLLNQTFKTLAGDPVFEWLIIDDGSTDETERLVSRFQEEADFPVRYYYQDNSGKHVAINKGVQLAQGEFFLIADSDDAFVPETLRIFYRYWTELTETQKRICAGINCLCRDGDTGKVIGDLSRIDSYAFVYDMPYMLKNRLYFERWGVTRTDIMRKFPFPELEGEHYFPEGFIWNWIGRRYKKVNTNEILRIVYFQKEGISKNIISSYIKNSKSHYLYHVVNLRENSDLLIRYDIIRFLKEIVQAGRLGTHCRFNPFNTARMLRNKPFNVYLFFLFFPIASVLAIRDRNKQNR
jgi:glycosyltransferase involved in cell wall biosynthesis